MADTKQTPDDATEPAVEPTDPDAPEPETEPETEAESEPEPETRAESETEPETRAESETEPEAVTSADDDPGLPYPTRLGWVVAAFLLFWPLAIPALVLSMRTAEANGTGNARRAKKSSVHTLDFALGAVGLGAIGIVALVVGVAAAPAYAASLPPGFVATASSFVPPVLAGPLGITSPEEDPVVDPSSSPTPADDSYLGAEPYPDASTESSGPASTPETDDPVVPSDDPTKSSDTTATAGSEIPDLEVGDCIDTAATSGQSTLYRIPVVPCTTAHGGEIYAETTASDDLAKNGETPSQQALWDAADAYCYPQFAKFVGMQWAKSELLYWPIAPSKESWADGDRRVLCVVESDKPVQGSLKGTAR